MDDPELEDSMTNQWPPGVVADHISRFLRGSPENFDIIVTFDNWGVSHHPNHIAVFKGCCQLLEQNQFRIQEILSLQSVNILRKYSGHADIQVLTPMDFNLCVLDPRPSYHSLALHVS